MNRPRIIFRSVKKHCFECIRTTMVIVKVLHLKKKSGEQYDVGTITVIWNLHVFFF